MKALKYLSIFALTIVLLQSCGTSTVSIGTFNVEWLGDGDNDQKKRTEDDYYKIAEVINSMNVDVLGLEEVENPVALKKVLQYLPGYSFYCGVGGAKQNVAVIYKTEVSVKLVGEYSPLAIEANRNRPGLVLECKKGNFDWTMMVVHLKSTSGYDKKEGKEEESRQRRAQQAEVLYNWADSIITNSKEKDVIIVGDFNDNPNRNNTSLGKLKNNPKINFLTDKLGSCANPKWDNIDQIMISNSVKSRMIDGSVFMFNFKSYLPEKTSKNISDHCPVFVTFDVNQKDND